jgi:hypothetical protein
VRVVILQLAEPPMIQGPEPLSVSSLGEMLSGSIQAVVLTRFPVHPRQITSFNYWFYSELGEGRTLEEAVQEGRRRLRQAPVVEDWAGFGAFAVITDGSREIRLVAPQVAVQKRQPRHTVDQRERDVVAGPHRRPMASAGFTRRP